MCFCLLCFSFSIFICITFTVKANLPILIAQNFCLESAYTSKFKFCIYIHKWTWVKSSLTRLTKLLRKIPRWKQVPNICAIHGLISKLKLAVDCVFGVLVLGKDERTWAFNNYGANRIIVREVCFNSSTLNSWQQQQAAGSVTDEEWEWNKSHILLYCYCRENNFYWNSVTLQYSFAIYIIRYWIYALREGWFWLNEACLLHYTSP